MFDMGAGDEAEEVLVEGVPPDSYLERFQVRLLGVVASSQSSCRASVVTSALFCSVLSSVPSARAMPLGTPRRPCPAERPYSDVVVIATLTSYVACPISCS